MRPKAVNEQHCIGGQESSEGNKSREGGRVERGVKGQRGLGSKQNHEVRRWPAQDEKRVPQPKPADISVRCVGEPSEGYRPKQPAESPQPEIERNAAHSNLDAKHAQTGQTRGEHVAELVQHGKDEHPCLNRSNVEQNWTEAGLRKEDRPESSDSTECTVKPE